MGSAADRFWSVTIVLSALGIGVATFWGVIAPIRPFLALWFLFICPGMALVRLLRLGDTLAEVIIALALSLALDALVAIGMVYTKTWSPDRGLGALIGLSILSVILGSVIPNRDQTALR